MSKVEGYSRILPTLYDENIYAFSEGENRNYANFELNDKKRIYPVPQSMHEYKICICSQFGLLFISVIILY
jgi:hypothetical protein